MTSRATPISPKDGVAPAPGDEAIRDNERAIEENKRMIALLARYQREDFAKYERLRQQCEARVHGSLADNAAPVIVRCIEQSW